MKESNIRSNIEMAKLPVFNREASIEKQIQWVIILCIERISRCMEREFIGRFGIRKSRIWVSRRIFV